MLSPGVGTLTLMPAPATIVVVLGWVTAAVSVAELPVPAPSWMFTATGIKLPPMTLNCAVPPTEVTLLVYPFGFQLETPAVKLMLAMPSVARAPNAVPLPPLGLFQTGIPAH